VKLVEAEGARALLVKADVSMDDQVVSMVQQTVDAFGGAAHPGQQRRDHAFRRDERPRWHEKRSIGTISTPST